MASSTPTVTPGRGRRAERGLAFLLRIRAINRDLGGHLPTSTRSHSQGIVSLLRVESVTLPTRGGRPLPRGPPGRRKIVNYAGAGLLYYELGQRSTPRERAPCSPFVIKGGYEAGLSRTA